MKTRFSAVLFAAILLLFPVVSSGQTGTPDILGLIKQMPAPAASASNAFAQLKWKPNARVYDPGDKLQAFLNELSQAQQQEGALDQAREKQEAKEVSQHVPASMQELMSDPKAQAELQKKLASMTQAQKIAFAMQMQQQMSGAMHPTGHVDPDLYNKLKQESAAALQRHDDFNQLFSKLDGVEKQWQNKASDLNKSVDVSIRKIPLAGEGEGGGCYSTAGAKQALNLTIARDDKQILLANDFLKQAAAVLAAAPTLISQDVTEARHLRSESQQLNDDAVSKTIPIRRDENELGDMKQYTDAVVHVDTEAADTVRARSELSTALFGVCPGK